MTSLKRLLSATAWAVAGLLAALMGGADPLEAVSADILISEVRTHGPAGSTDEYVELYNRSGAPVNIGGWQIRGSTGAGATVLLATVPAGVLIGPGCHVLVGHTGYTPIVNQNITIPADFTYNALDVPDNGGFAVVRPDGVTIVDQVGMSAGSTYKEGTPLPPISVLPVPNHNSRSHERKEGGTFGNGVDTDDNSADFLQAVTSDPQNAAQTCFPPFAGTNPTGNGAAAPSTVPAGGTTLLTVTVTPGTNPPSSGIQVTGDLSLLGGPPAQAFSDHGTNGDLVAGDLVFSYEVTVEPATAPGAKALPATIADAEGRTGNTVINLTVTAPGGPNDSDGDGLPNAWETRFLLDPQSAAGENGAGGDPDADGVSNKSEFEAGTDPTLSNVWTLSEGSTGFFRQRFALVNPGMDTAVLTVTYLTESGAPQTIPYSIPPRRRLTIDVNAEPGLSNAAVSAVVTVTKGGVAVERTMGWDATLYGGHTGKAITRPRMDWFLAEGDARFFDTYILFANANAAAASVTATYLLENGSTIQRNYTVPRNARLTVFANDVPGLRGNSFSTTISSSTPITVERAMYFSGARFWEGGHESAAVEAAATDWFVAEGRTGPFFDMYLLLANPGPFPTTARVRYLVPGGAVVNRTYALAPTSRQTVHVDSIEGLEDTDVSAAINADDPIIVERAMYWPDPFPNWYEAHNSAGVTTTGIRWVLAEGELGGPLNYETYVLIANPQSVGATVTLTFLRENSGPLVTVRPVPANSRLTISAGELPLAPGEKFGVLVDSTVPVVVERAMYWNGGGQFWGAGTNETAVRMR